MKYGYIIRTNQRPDTQLYVDIIVDVLLSDTNLYQHWIKDIPHTFYGKPKIGELLNAIDSTKGVESSGLLKVEGHTITVRILPLGDERETVNRIVKKIQRRYYPKGESRRRYKYNNLCDWLKKVNEGGKII